MQRIWSTEARSHIGERVKLAGWLHRLRKLGSISFLILRDGKGTVQVVLEDHEAIEKLAGAYGETVMTVEGLAVAETQAPGGVEIRQPRVELLSISKSPPPFDLFHPVLKEQLPAILDHAPIALRHPRHRAIFQLASAAMEGFRSSLRAMDFVEIQTPKIVGSATEGGANVFHLDYFGRPAYLAQSPQFYKQAMVGVFERVFEVGPVFRAEPHDTPRHLNEYVSLDAEMGFIDDHHTVMQVLTATIRGMLEALCGEQGAALALLEVQTPRLPEKIPSIHFAEALDLICRETGEDAREEPDLAPAHERFLGDWARREYGSEFIFVTGYPMRKRPFYTCPDPVQPAYSNSFDLLFRGLELVTGGQRLHRYEDYLTAMEARGISPEYLGSYLEAFKYGMPPHGGFAIGLERFIARLIGAQNIRETALFPRDLNRLAP